MNTKNCLYCNRPFTEELWCKECIDSLEKLAENGDKKAMFSLANCYKNGKGTEKNLEKAFYLYQKTAANDHINAMLYLSTCYRNGEGTEKSLEKAFYWCQKAAEKGQINAMYNLAVHYKHGEGIEKNFEKAFYWCQKAAEKGQIDAMYSLAVRYKHGEGIEKNFEKAFHWYQKAAEKEHIIAMFNLVIHYYYGKGTKKNLEKAFHWCQKAAEKGQINVMFKLAIFYRNGERTEKNFEKAFYWYQKAAEKDHIIAMFDLANFYKNGKGTEKNLEKAFHWYQKAAKKSHIDAIFNLVACYRNGEGTKRNLERAFYWYQIAIETISTRFFKWTSKNKFIDEFVQEAQLNAKNSYEILEWIPYNNLSSIDYYAKGGFSEINKAIWSDGPIFSWNFDKQQWNRQTYYEVILKSLNNSSSLNNEFLNEWKYHYNCQKKSFSKFIQFFGFTQDPNNLNYIIVMSYAKKGSLRKCLPDIVKFKWQDKLRLLKKIILGLKVIHESNLTHGDFHDDSDKKINEIYGVLPYMAPEILRKKPYSSASDIYSLSMIMWEFTSGIPPFNYEAHDHHFILSVYEGKRPKITKNTPKCYTNLMKKCWDLNPSNRPTIIMLENIISEWIRCINKYYEVNRDENYKYRLLNIDDQLTNDMLEFVEANKSLVQKQVNTSIIQSHPQAHFTSRKLTEILVQVESQGFDLFTVLNTSNDNY
ncbi:kinase-like domain-containing protein [Rhizophagus irregularis DAOM 181602=DAOM 197198]|nr:kinase-like domain-containing protein [Rhizophagus irregularis DAOM 181602=DAOM 197198]